MLATWQRFTMAGVLIFKGDGLGTARRPLQISDIVPRPQDDVLLDHASSKIARITVLR